jgi:hypothetical protein
MDGVKQWMSDNQVFSGIAGAVLIFLLGVIVDFFRRQKRRKASSIANTIQTGHVAGTGNVVNFQGTVNSLTVGGATPVSPPAENVRVDVKGVTPAGRRFSGCIEGCDNQGRQIFHQEAWTSVPACLNIVCHNLTATPVVIDQIRLLNADSRQEVQLFDPDPKRIDGLDFVEIPLNLPLNMSPPLRGMISITTVRCGSFDSREFEWGKTSG